MHGIGNGKIFSCNFRGCKYKTKLNGSLKIHKWAVHGIGNGKIFVCDVGGCDYKTKLNGSLKIHKWAVHNIGNGEIFSCNFRGCPHYTKIKGSLKTHKWYVHNIGNGEIYKCDVILPSGKCYFQNKTKSGLKTHKWNVHDIGDGKIFVCDIGECNYRTKAKSNIKTHKEGLHDIGEYQCEFCYCNRNSSIPYNDFIGNHKICKKCYKKATGKSSRIETIWSDYLDLEFGTQFLTSSDKSLKSLGGCQLYRPDKLYVSKNVVLLLECDEHQHNRKNSDYSCDEKRISDIYNEPGICGKKMIVIRWNPDHYKLPQNDSIFYDKDQKTKNRDEKLKLCKNLMEYVIDNYHGIESKIFIYYMFYNEDSDRISLRIPNMLIFNKSDFEDDEIEDKLSNLSI